MEAWLEVGSQRLLLAVDEGIAKRIEIMTNQQRMDLRFALSEGLRDFVLLIFTKGTKH